MNDVTNAYEVAFNEEQHDTALVRVLEGKFKDFVYKYGVVQVNDDEGDTTNLSYEYTLLEAPAEYTVDNEEAEREEFEQLVGDILYDIIVNSAKVKEARDGN